MTQQTEYKEYVSGFYNDFAQNWDGRFQGRKAARYFLNKRLAYLQSEVGTDFESILEIACGTGYHLLRLTGPGQKGLGIDIAEQMLAVAKKNKKNSFDHLNVDFRLADGEALALADNSFDRVIFIGYLSHVQQRQQALAEIFRVLKPGGRLVGLVSNRWSPWYWCGLRKVLTKDYGKLPRDKELSPPEVRQMAAACGFAPVRTRVFNSLPGKTPDWLYYPLRVLNVIFCLWPISLLGWHILLTAQKPGPEEK